MYMEGPLGHYTAVATSSARLTAPIPHPHYRAQYSSISLRSGDGFIQVGLLILLGSLDVILL